MKFVNNEFSAFLVKSFKLLKFKSELIFEKSLFDSPIILPKLLAKI